MTKISTTNHTSKIVELHKEILNSLKMSLEKGIEIGHLLREQKDNLEHGKWLPWIKDNLPFSDQTARNYIRLYDRKDELKIKTVLNLKDAYKLLNPPKADYDFDSDEHMNRKRRANVIKLTAIFYHSKDHNFSYEQAYDMALWYVQWAYILELMHLSAEDPELKIDGRPYQEVIWKEYEKNKDESLDDFEKKIGL